MISTDTDLAVERLRAGGLVAMPTETVYGLAADARNADAVARIFSIKSRPTDHPLIVHLHDGDQVDLWADDVPEPARVLAATCWPGPLTMLLRRGSGVHDVVTGGRPTIGLRVPGHPVAAGLLERFGSGLAAPSANRFGRVSPTSARHVVDDIGHLLDPDRDLVLDGGPSIVGVESTIVDLTADPPQVLRVGAITERDLERILGSPLGEAHGPSRASGMLEAHYAPSCVVYPAADRAAADRLVSRLRRQDERVQILDRADDPVEAARSLYADLRDADAAGLDALVVVLPPAEGIGLAVRDRVTKAAAGRGPTSRGG